MKHGSFLATGIAMLLLAGRAAAQQVDYSVVSVPEERGLDFMQVTSASDCVRMPEVRRSARGVEWFTNRIADISTDGTGIAYLSLRNGASNIFIKELNRRGSSVQRTNRRAVVDFSYSPDGRFLCFSEQIGPTVQIFRTDARNGYVCRQITSGCRDFSPVYSSDLGQIFFARQENRGCSIWSQDLGNHFLSSYTTGMNPCPVPGEQALLCTRLTAAGKSEIWKIDYESGIEECIVSDPARSFTSPALSPDGAWILLVGESALCGEGFTYYNTDIYACRIDGSDLVQLTYHAADDLSPVWSRDGRSIYFVSQRGDADGAANIWKMSFPY